MDKQKFIENIEKLVNPNEVAALSFIQSFNKYLPKKLQNRLVEKSALKYPYMGFIVEPYSYFLCYEIKDLNEAQALLPKDFTLCKTKVFSDEEAKYYCIFGCINTRTSAFTGLRVECYIIAEDNQTGLLSWVIVDYDTNTISYDKENGLREPNTKRAFITTDFKGNLSAEVINENNRTLIFTSKIREGVLKSLDSRLWIEGNLSIAYGKKISLNDPYVFSLKFHPDEFKEALDIPIDSTTIKLNTWYPELIEEHPTKVVCFPFAQHFLSDSPGHSSQLTSQEEMVKNIESINFDLVEVYTTKSLKKLFLIGSLFSFLIILILLLLLILK